MSLESLVCSHVRGRSNQQRLVEKFRSELEREKLRLRVDIFNDSTGEQTVGISPVILNTNSRCYGTIDLHFAHPLQSCERGGRIIIIVSEFELSKDFMAQPRFLVFDSEDHELTELQRHIQQAEAEDIRVHKDTIIFRTPKQSPEFIEKLIKNSWKIKLCIVKEFSGFSMKSKNVEFKFEQHDISAGGELGLCCVFCHLPLDFPPGVSPFLPEPSCRPGPKKRRLVNSSLEIAVKKSLIEVQTDSLTLSSSSRSKDVEFSDKSVRRKDREIISTVRNPRATVNSHFPENSNVSWSFSSWVLLSLMLISLCYIILCFYCDGSVANGFAITVLLLIVSGLLMEK